MTIATKDLEVVERLEAFREYVHTLACDETVEDRALDIDPLRAQAHLAAVREHRPRGAPERGVEIGGGEADRRVLAAALARPRLPSARRPFPGPGPGLCAPGPVRARLGESVARWACSLWSAIALTNCAFTCTW